jgi:hypothetical protein
MSRHRAYPDLLTTILGMSLKEIEWRAPYLTRAEVATLNARAKRLGELIAEDWKRAALERSAQIAALIQQDQEWLVEENAREQQARDLEDSARIAHAMIESLLTPTERLRKAMKAEQHELQRWREQINRAARAKVKGSKARR